MRAAERRIGRAAMRVLEDQDVAGCGGRQRDRELVVVVVPPSALAINVIATSGHSIIRPRSCTVQELPGTGRDVDADAVGGADGRAQSAIAEGPHPARADRRTETSLARWCRPPSCHRPYAPQTPCRAAGRKSGRIALPSGPCRRWSPPRSESPDAHRHRRRIGRHRPRESRSCPPPC